MNNLLKSIAVLSVASTFTFNAMAQTETPPGSSEILSEPVAPSVAKKEVANEDIERIGVSGKVPLLFFKREAMLAELDFYEQFNAVADKEEFKMKCRKEARTGSRIKSTVCYPEYVLRRMAEETQAALSRGSPYPTLEDVEFMVREEREESMKYVEEIVKNNPQLKAQLLEMAEKQRIYKEKKAQVFN